MFDTVIEKTDVGMPSTAVQSASSTSTSSGALARRFVEMLLQNAGKIVKNAETASAETPDEFLSAFGISEDGEEQGETIEPTLSVDEAVAAVLLAGRFEDDPSLLKALRKDAPVVVVQALDARSIPAFETVLRICALGRSTSILSMGAIDGMGHSGSMTLDRRHAVIFNCDVEKRNRPILEHRCLTSLSLGIPVCALSVDVGRSVPEQIRIVADKIMVPGGWNAALLGILLEAVTGVAISIPAENWISSLTVDDLRMSISRQRGVSDSLDRLRSTVRRRTSKSPDLPDFHALHGYGEAKRIAGEVLSDLIDFRHGLIGWDAVPRGLVLAGPTGTGKTFLVRCFAKSSGLPLVIGSMAQWQSAGDGHLGDCLGAMKRSFAEARAAAPSILFIDEIDSIGDREKFHARHRDYSSQVVNGLLEELDGAGDRSGVFVFAATNHLDRIDAAVLRPGRLDRAVHIERPGVPDLAGILRTQLGADLPDADLMPVALAGRGGTGASVALWVRQARGIARRAGRDLEIADLLTAVRDGRPSIPVEDRRRIALHESAHACAAVALDIGTLHGVSLHDGGGTTEVVPAMRTTTRTEALAAIVHLLAGRAAERMFLGSVSAGSGGSVSSDLALATRVACGIEGSWGLGELGPVWLGEPEVDLATFVRAPGFGAAIGRLLLHCETEANRLVRLNENAITRCADRLLNSGYLDADAAIEALGDVPHFLVAPGPHMADADNPAS